MVFPKQEFNKASVKDADINKGLLADLFNKIEDEKLNIHSMVLLKNGSRVFRASAFDYTEETKENVYSISKSFTSVAIGILSDLKLLNVEDYVLFYFSGDIDHYDPGYEALKIKHLLSMSVGQGKDVFYEATPNDNIYELFFNQELIHEPGKEFFYNNAASFILSAIVTKVTGKTLNDFLNEYLYQPIGMEKPEWNQVNDISFGCTGLQISTNDMARFGLLLLNDGVWDGVQIVSKEYLALATTQQIDTLNHDNPYDQFGYGYQFWLNSFGDFRSAGMYKQYIIVNKEYNMVFAIKAYEERETLDLFENFILKAAKVGWNYCDYSLRDYIRKFRSNSEEIIKKEKEMRIE